METTSEEVPEDWTAYREVILEVVYRGTWETGSEVVSEDRQGLLCVFLVVTLSQLFELGIQFLNVFYYIIELLPVLL